MKAIARQIVDQYTKSLAPYLQEYALKQDDQAIGVYQIVGDLLNQKIDQAIPALVTPAFNKMSSGVIKSTKATTQKVLGVTVNDIGLGATVDRFRDANIQLMKKLNDTYLNDVKDELSQPDAFGLTASELGKRISERTGITERHAELIARDQTNKLSGNINMSRQMQAGVDSYIWSTSQDERVRDEHAALEGEEFNWPIGDASEGNPGDAIMCRCVAIPVIPDFAESDDEEL